MIVMSLAWDVEWSSYEWDDNKEKKALTAANGSITW